ncbi:hypothetical protein BGZ67_009916 [Mortierella alpina]|nr:hypothetical protein BGZ67_009916 [Mortierella alpina]
MYTWKNATLGEITSLVKQAIPNMIQDARPGSVLSFRHIFLDLHRGLFVGRDVGVVDIEPTQQLSLDENLDNHITTEHSAETNMASQALQEKTLGSFNFVIGDYLDIAILPPTARSSQPQTTGGPMRNRGERFRRTGGGPGGAAGVVTDRFAGRLGGGIFSGNGHGQRPIAAVGGSYASVLILIICSITTINSVSNAPENRGCSREAGATGIEILVTELGQRLLEH